jgi:hypothetical protein
MSNPAAPGGGACPALGSLAHHCGALTGSRPRIARVSRKQTERSSGLAETYGSRVGLLLDASQGHRLAWRPRAGRPRRMADAPCVNSATLCVDMKRVETCAEFVEASPASSTKLVWRWETRRFRRSAGCDTMWTYARGKALNGCAALVVQTVGDQQHGKT